MGVITTTTYVCEQCGTKSDIESGPMGGGVYPQGWYQLMPTYGGLALWFDKWECIRDYAGAKVDATAAAAG